MSTANVPASWKSAIVVPIFKKGCRNSVKNYRPISLTSIACKLMESVIKDAVLAHLFSYNLVSSCQYGFLARRSTTIQLLHCCNKWLKNLSKGIQVDIVYLDFAKAFDSVVHNKLLSKLHSFGFGGNLLNWVSSFLVGRSQRVRIGRALSAPVVVKSGVPQGSVLGPLLFTLFINDISQYCDIAKSSNNVYLFADDIKNAAPITTVSDCVKFQLSVSAINIWSTNWQLPLAHDKCSVLRLCYAENLICYPYHLDNVVLPVVDAATDLGILMDYNLSFSSHIAGICNKAWTRCALIFKCFQSRDAKLLFKAFTVFIRPTLEYASPVNSAL